MLLIYCLAYRLPAWVGTDIVLAPLYGLVILGGAGLSGLIARVLANPVLVLLGEASYSIYILHMVLFWWWLWIERKLFGHGVRTPIELLVVSAVIVGITVLSFLWLEKPMRRRILDWLR